jgi:hypothetical protein
MFPMFDPSLFQNVFYFHHGGSTYRYWRLVRLAGADLLWEKSIVGWLADAGLLWEKNIADWWLENKPNKAIVLRSW